MVVAGKVFKLSESLSIEEVASRLEGYRTEEEYEEGDYKYTLVAEVVGLTAKNGNLNGIYSHDYVIHIFHRGKIVPLPRTVEAVFSFASLEDKTLLTIVEKKRLANFIANKMNIIASFSKLHSKLCRYNSTATIGRIASYSYIHSKTLVNPY